MADGVNKPISQVEIGDLVLATDLETGTSGPHLVEDVIVGDGLKDLVEIAVDANDDGLTEVITATDQHPIYAKDRGEFVDAAALTEGTHLLSPAGTDVKVGSIERTARPERVYNLTVAKAHTFYVAADNSSFLTHNCAKQKKPWKPNKNKRPKESKESKESSEHTKGKRQSTKGKHEKGQARKDQVINDKKRQNGGWTPGN